jgi:hypothetical protein
MEKEYEELLKKSCNELQLTNQAVDFARKILEEKDDDGQLISEKYRHAIGGAIYIAAIVEDERRTQKEVSEVIGCSGSTIGITYKKIHKGARLMIDAEMWKDFEKRYGRVDHGVARVLGKELLKEAGLDEETIEKLNGNKRHEIEKKCKNDKKDQDWKSYVGDNKEFGFSNYLVDHGVSTMIKNEIEAGRMTLDDVIEMDKQIERSNKIRDEKKKKNKEA